MLMNAELENANSPKGCLDCHIINQQQQNELCEPNPETETMTATLSTSKVKPIVLTR
jgi:hypothetical protein